MKRFFLAALLAAPLAAAAHHGWSEYDTAKPLKLTGKIVESGYEHPHGHVRFGERPGKTWIVIARAAVAHGEPRAAEGMAEGRAPAPRSRATPTATSPKRCAPSESPSTARPSN